NGDSSWLGPIEHGARLTRMKAVRKLMFHHHCLPSPFGGEGLGVRGSFALEVGDLLEDDHLLVPAYLVHFEHHDIAGIRNDLPQSWHGCNVRPGWGGCAKE